MGNTGQGTGNGGGGSGASLAKRVGHPTVTEHFDEGMTDFERVSWIQEHSSLNESSAAEANSAIYYFSDTGYPKLHDPKTAIDKAIVAQADKALTDPKMPVWKGEIHRGLAFMDDKNMTARQQVDAILKKGTWKEPGLTSFSSSKEIAEDFASGGDVEVLVHVTNNKSGVPIKHLSYYPHEDEVLINSKTAQKGWKINQYKWSGNRVDVYVTEP